ARSPVAPKKTSASDRKSLISTSLGLCLFGRLLQMSTKLISHCGQELIRKGCFSPRRESFKQRRSQNRHRHRFINCSLDGPAAFTRVRHTACESGKTRIFV